MPPSTPRVQLPAPEGIYGTPPDGLRQPTLRLLPGIGKTRLLPNDARIMIGALLFGGTGQIKLSDGPVGDGAR